MLGSAHIGLEGSNRCALLGDIPVAGGSNEAPGDPAAYELLFEEAVRGVEGQRQSLDELRYRAGILISTATLVAGFVGPTALAADAPARIEVTAVGLLLLAVLTSL
jgi:hypothetical protein